MTKLAAIYNVWDGEELLEGSVNCLRGHVDVFIFVVQKISNYGEPYNPLSNMSAKEGDVLIIYDPIVGNGGTWNEMQKRNIGLNVARQAGCTHFIHMDVDEYYEDFGQAKKLFLESGASGSVCKLWTYFKKPTLRLAEPEGYYVPFIHELRQCTRAGNKTYPFYVDPTRRINETNVVELPVMMHHFSYVRRDIERKVRNSSARHNIERGTTMQDYSRDLKAGDYVECYRQKLVEVEDIFGIRSSPKESNV